MEVVGVNTHFEKREEHRVTKKWTKVQASGLHLVQNVQPERDGGIFNKCTVTDLEELAICRTVVTTKGSS